MKVPFLFERIFRAQAIAKVPDAIQGAL